MKLASKWSPVFSAVLVSSACIFACASTPTVTAPTSDGGASSSSSGGGDDDDGPTTPILTQPGDDDDSTTPKSDAGTNCNATTTKNDCGQCCGVQHAAGYKTYTAAVTSCMCTTNGGICVPACTPSLCANKTADANCAECANDRLSSCSSSVQTACNVDPDCVQYSTCLSTAKCSTKP